MAIRESPGDRFDALVGAIDAGVVVHDATGTIRSANPAAERILGLSAEQLLGLTAADPRWRATFDDGRVADPAETPSAVALATGVPVTGVVMHIDRVGEEPAVVTVAAVPLRDDDSGEITGVVVSFIDITASRRSRDALIAQRDRGRALLDEQRATEARFRMIAENATDLITSYTPDLVCTYASPASRALAGVEPEEIVGLNLLDLVRPVDPDQRRRLRHELVHGTGHGRAESILRHADGHDVWIESTVRAVRGGNDEIIELHVSSRDITERKRLEWSLRESEARFRLLATNSTDVIIRFDRDARLQYVSPAAVRILGYEPDATIGRTVFEFIHPDDLDDVASAFGQALDGREFGWVEFRARHADGRFIWMEASARAEHEDGLLTELQASLRDVTERRASGEALRRAEIARARDAAEVERQRLELELEQARRLESLGRLAGGLAHDFNNQLGVILNYASLISKEADPGSRIEGDAGQIVRSADRAAELIRKLLLFARREPVREEVFDLNTVVGDLVGLLQRPLGGEVELVARPASTACPIAADEGQIEQVLTNLVLNARDAMPTGGTITIATAVEPDGWIRLEVTDTGTGMPPDVAERAFDPFFTTKPRDEGSGLGLAAVHGVVASTGGTVRIETALGAGTSVVVRFPAAVGHTTHDTVAATTRPEGAVTGNTILLLEDEDDVRTVTARILTEAGYEVIEAADGGEAATADPDGRAALLVADLRIPGTTGREVAAALTARRPDLRVLFVSGHAAEVFPAGVPGAFLAKPFSPEELLRAVRATLAPGIRSSSRVV